MTLAARHGKHADLTIAGTSLQEFTDSEDLDLTIATGDITTFGHNWKKALVGLGDGKLAVTGKYDPTVTTGPMALINAQLMVDGVAMVYYPGGNVTGQESVTFSAIITGVKRSSKIGSEVTFSFDMMMTGDPTFALVA